MILNVILDGLDGVFHDFGIATRVDVDADEGSATGGALDTADVDGGVGIRIVVDVTAIGEHVVEIAEVGGVGVFVWGDAGIEIVDVFIGMETIDGSSVISEDEIGFVGPFVVDAVALLERGDIDDEIARIEASGGVETADGATVANLGIGGAEGFVGLAGGIRLSGAEGGIVNLLASAFWNVGGVIAEVSDGDLVVMRIIPAVDGDSYDDNDDGDDTEDAK